VFLASPPIRFPTTTFYVLIVWARSTRYTILTLFGIASTMSIISGIPYINGKPTWIKPKLVPEIRFDNWTNEKILRAPIFQRFREDKSPEDCTGILKLVVVRMKMKIKVRNLDTMSRGFKSAVKVAFHLKELFDELKIISNVKTPGKTCLHIFVPVICAYVPEMDVPPSLFSSDYRFSSQSTSKKITTREYLKETLSNDENRGNKNA
jgi:hypothetical protein